MSATIEAMAATVSDLSDEDLSKEVAFAIRAADTTLAGKAWKSLLILEQQVRNAWDER